MFLSSILCWSWSLPCGNRPFSSPEVISLHEAEEEKKKRRKEEKKKIP